MIRLPYLSDHMKRDVYSHSFTAGWDNAIYLEVKYAQLIEREGLLNTKSAILFPKRTARAIYYLLHEYRHTMQTTYHGVRSELEANEYAAGTFKSWCFKLGYGKRTTARLWRSLPEYYQHPEAI